MTHGSIAKLPRVKARVLAALLLFSSSAFVSISAEEKTTQGKEPSVSKEEKLKERDRYAEEAAKLRAEGKTREAIEACQKMLAIEREVLGDLHDDVVSSLEQLADMHEALGDFERAQFCRKEILGIRTQLYGEADWRVTDARLDLEELKRRSELDPQQRSELVEARRLNQQVFDLWQKGRSSEALPLATRAAEIRGRLLGKESREYAESLLNVGAQYHATGNVRQAEEVCKQAVEICRKALGEEHPNHAAGLNHLAELYSAMGDYARAEPLFRQALEITKKALGEENPSYATSLNSLAGLYRDKADYARAEPLYRQASEIWKKTLGEENSDYAGSLNNLALLYQAMGEYTRAEPLFRRASGICGKALGQEHPDYATSLNNLAMNYQAMGDYPRAAPLFRRASEIWKKALGEEHRHYAASLNNLAMNYQAMGDYARAEPLFSQVLQILKKALGEEHRDYATALNNLASLYQVMGDYTRAEPLFHRASEIWRKALGEEHPDYAASLTNLAAFYREMGDYAQAEPLFRQALQILTKALGAEHPHCAAGLNNLARLYKDMGDYAQAEGLYLEASKVWKSTLGEENGSYAASINNLALLYEDLGDYARAEPLCRQALEIRKKSLGEEHPDYAVSLNNLAAIYLEMENYVRAEQLLQQALEITKKALGEEHPDYARNLNNLATVYEERGDYTRAERLLRQALEITKMARGEGHPHCTASLNNLAGLYAATGDYARAERLLTDSLRISQRSMELASRVQSERQQLAMAGSLRGTLHAYLSIGSRAGLSGAELYEPVLLWKGAVWTHQRRQRLERSRPELRGLFVDLENASSRLAALAFSAPEPGKHPVWKRQIEELTERKEALERELSSRCAEYRRETALWRLSPAELQGLLPQEVALVDFLEYTDCSGRETSEGRRGSSSQSVPVTRADEKEAAEGAAEAGGKPAEPKAGAEGASKEARKGPQRTERTVQHLAGFVILRDAPVVELDLGPLATIEEDIDAWRGAIASGAGSKSEAEAATKLRKSLWEPLKKHLAGRGVVLVSPDGALGRFPFGALPGSKPGSYLIEEVSIAILPVPQMLPDLVGSRQPAASRQLSEAAPSLLLVGDVDFDTEPSRSEAAAVKGPEAAPSMEVAALGEEVREAPRGGGLFQFRPLDFTGREIRMVADRFEAAYRGGRVSRLRGKEATERAVRETAAQREFLHLATHGFFAPQELRSVLAPSKQEGRGGGGLKPGLGPAGNLAGWHPGLLSGIVLAGGNGRPSPERDDGILTALELATLDLGRTELMVLSACETGLGATAGGEGLLGLQRAAQVAGAKTVVASLWSVGDQEAFALMTIFYTNLWAKRMPKLEALRDAQLRFLRGEVESGGASVALGAGGIAQGAEGQPGRGAGGTAPRPEGKSDAKSGARFTTTPRASPRAWAAWVLSGDWR